jgi:hypothetical protein
VAAQAGESVGEFAAPAAVEKKAAMRKMASLRERNNVGLLKTETQNWLEEDAIVA